MPLDLYQRKPVRSVLVRFVESLWLTKPLIQIGILSLSPNNGGAAIASVYYVIIRGMYVLCSGS